MKLRDYPDVSGDTIFCDDIRQEIGGKVSFMGCYPGTIFLHEPFPFTFQKFCFYITLVQRREVFDPNIEIMVYLPGDAEDAPSLRFKGSETSPGAVAEQTAKEIEGLPLSDQRVLAAHIALVATPLVIKEAGILSVRAVRQGELIRLGGRRIVLAPNVQQPPNPATP
jgi:hypothetical protein